MRSCPVTFTIDLDKDITSFKTNCIIKIQSKMKNVIELTSLEKKSINGGTNPTNGVYDDGNGGCIPPFFPPLQFPTDY